MKGGPHEQPTLGMGADCRLQAREYNHINSRSTHNMSQSSPSTFIIHVQKTPEGLASVRFLNNAYQSGDLTGKSEPVTRFFGMAWDATGSGRACREGIHILPGLDIVAKDGRACVALNKAVHLQIEHEITFDGRLVTRNDAHLIVAEKFAELHGSDVKLDEVEQHVEQAMMKVRPALEESELEYAGSRFMI